MMNEIPFIIPDLIIAAKGNTTQIFVKGIMISKGVNDVVYSARDSEGKLNPTIRLLDIEVSEFSVGDTRSIDRFVSQIQKARDSGVNKSQNPGITN